jgi:3-hydroxymyristoyl/3-hydroxydecanoyl-(acyl carrier protein) dehydratase
MFRFGGDPTEAIPHRPPILCIDRILDADQQHAVAERVVAHGELWELALIEGLAQTAGVLNAYDAHVSGRLQKHGMLVGVRRLVVHRRARAGERIVFRVELIRRIAPLTLMRCEAKVGEEMLAAGDMKFYVEDA